MIPRNFDLPWSGAGGHGRGVVVEEMALGWDGPRQHRRDYNDIAAIELEAEAVGDDPFARCDIFFADGVRLRLLVDNDGRHTDDVLAYREFVPAFFERLGPRHRARIVFRQGPRPAKRIASIIASAAFTAAFFGLAVALPFSDTLWQDNEWLLIPLVLLMGGLSALMLGVSLKLRQLPFDPQSLPEALLPALPRPRA
jgi:hypothetical protein